MTYFDTVRSMTNDPEILRAVLAAELDERLKEYKGRSIQITITVDADKPSPVFQATVNPSDLKSFLKHECKEVKTK